MEKNEEILEKAKNYIIEIRKRDNNKIKIYEKLVEKQIGDRLFNEYKYYFIPTKDMFDTSFYTFMTAIKELNEFISYISYNEINEKIDNMIKTLKDEYSEHKKKYTNHELDSNKQREILRRTETLYMITFYVYKRLMNMKDRHRYDIPLKLFSYLNE